MEPRHYRNFCPSYRGFTAVTAILSLFPSPCSSRTQQMSMYMRRLKPKKKLVKCHFRNTNIFTISARYKAIMFIPA